MKKSIAVVVKGYPRLSETFIAREILALQQAGASLMIFSLRRPGERQTHPVHQAIRAAVVQLPEYLWREPLRVLRAWRMLRKRDSYRCARRVWLRDLRRDFSANRARRFGQALVLAAELPARIELLYAHFLHTPASVARYASMLSEVAWSCSAHAKDIWTTPEWEKREKLTDCRWLTTCTRVNFLHLRELAARPEKVSLNYHGIDLAQFAPHTSPHSARTGAARDDPVRILSVGRAVAKKGGLEMLDALAMMPRNVHWQLTHIGDGPQLREYQRRARAHGIDQRIRWLGAQPQRTVIECYRDADFFALNCRITADGDRDGLPNVLLEAQSQSLPVASTNISGIVELIADDVNGLLVDADDTRAFADALLRLIADPALRRRLGDAGQKIVTEQFDRAHNFAPLYRLIAGDAAGEVTSNSGE